MEEMTIIPSTTQRGGRTHKKFICFFQR